METVGDSYIAGELLLFCFFFVSYNFYSPEECSQSPSQRIPNNQYFGLFSKILLYFIVAGLPEPRFDHAVVMVKFGWAIINAMETKVLQLEVLLGPGTSNLTIRVGVRCIRYILFQCINGFFFLLVITLLLTNLF